MTPEKLAVIERRLSAERFGPYRVLSGGDPAAALALYEWNLRVASAWWTVIADVEVLVRNAMHERLTTWSTAKLGESRWYLDPAGMLSPQAQSTIAAARDGVTRNGRPETPGRVVSELSLGFWRFLLSARYERTLWRVCLFRAFPGEGLRRNVHDALHGLHGLRNRIAHHEPIHAMPLARLHGDALEVAGWICPVTASWIGRRSGVPGLLSVRPANLGSPN